MSSVTKKSTAQYYQKLHNYNSLQVGNFWEYEQTDIDGSKHYFRRSVVKDTIVNSKKYFKKVDYRGYGAIVNGVQTTVHYFNWERNDTIKKASYMLDIEDLNNNGKTDDELLLDSLEIPKNPYPRVFLSYRYTWKNAYEYSNPSFVRFSSPRDSTWAIIFGDTVITRHIEYEGKSEEIVAEKYGVVNILKEGPAAVLSGAIINGKQYGTIVSVEETKVNLPSDIVLYNNYPNPFNPTTIISFSVPHKSQIKLSVFDVLGREVSILANGIYETGKYEISFNASNLPSGIYFYSLANGSSSITRKMILMK
ncbi:MAG: T9SS type A sorting domain-containing protein [Bacteroidetes bacterium]|nr:T9SS type A sorting domain-containing protein [Bacteroidota bacterium]